MSSGWNLQEGKIPFREFKTEDVFHLVNSLYAPYIKRTTSYKYAFFKSILDNIFNVDLLNPVLSFEEIFEKFTEIYWNQVMCYGIKQNTDDNHKSSIETALTALKIRCFPSGIVPRYEVAEDQYKKEALKIVSQIGRKYVVGALFNDSNGQLYSFSKTTESIYLNPSVLVCLIKYKSFFERLNYYEWEKYLEKCNKGTALPYGFMFEDITKRTNLDKYRTFLLKTGGNTCFYCHKKIENTPPVDHFVPWSFVRDDKLWNFVLACPKCNSKKKDFLVPESITNDIIMRNKKIITIDDALVKEDFTEYTDDRIPRMYESAKDNGWQQLENFPLHIKNDVLQC